MSKTKRMTVRCQLTMTDKREKYNNRSVIFYVSSVFKNINYLSINQIY